MSNYIVTANVWVVGGFLYSGSHGWAFGVAIIAALAFVLMRIADLWSQRG